MSKAQDNAAAKRESDLAFLGTYISTEAGATGQQNADVLGRLLVDAHARLDEAAEHIGKLEARLTAMLAAVQIAERQTREATTRLAEVQIAVVAMERRLEISTRQVKGEGG